MISKINFVLSQLSSADLFLGYTIANWNSRINYFLLGKRFDINLFDLNYTYLLVKKFIFVFHQTLLKRGRIWVINENFKLFNLLNLIKLLHNSGIFKMEKWTYGLLTNRRSVISTCAIPHIIFITNVFQNAYIINESLALNIPVVGLADTNENPLNHTFPIPGNSKSLNSVYFFYMLIFRLVKLTNLNNKEFFIKAIKNRLNIHKALLYYLFKFILFKMNITQWQSNGLWSRKYGFDSRYSPNK